MVIASYNVHQCVGLDRRRSPTRIAAVVSELDAIIVGLQEVDARPGREPGLDQLAEIARAAGFAFVRGPTLLRHDGHYGNGLLTRAPVRNARLIDLSLPGREPRGAIDVEVEHAGRRIRVVATHLGLAPDERRAQCSRLLESLAPARAFDLSVLIGDFNEWWMRRELLQRLHRCFGYTRSVRTYPSPAPVLALDRIWVRPASALVELYAHRSRLARRASDHLPLRARIALPGASACDARSASQIPPSWRASCNDLEPEPKPEREPELEIGMAGANR
jgi:endonuclease/exonuclease/phosphatase family metal-dependent hydrolase